MQLKYCLRSDPYSRKSESGQTEGKINHQFYSNGFGTCSREAHGHWIVEDLSEYPNHVRVRNGQYKIVITSY